MVRQHVSSGAPWEDRFGYARAVKAGNQVHVSGTTAVDEDGSVIGVGDPARQTEVALQIIEDALEEVGSTIDDVIRTRMYVADIGDYEAIGTVHGEVFEDVKPATLLVEVAEFVDSDMLVEIEATAIIDE